MAFPPFFFQVPLPRVPSLPSMAQIGTRESMHNTMKTFPETDWLTGTGEPLVFSTVHASGISVDPNAHWAQDKH